MRKRVIIYALSLFFLMIFISPVNCLADGLPRQPVLGKAGISAKGIIVRWKASAGAEKYYLYRRSSIEKGWKRIASVTGLRWTDTEVITGVTYVYTVRAVNENGLSTYDRTGSRCIFVSQPMIQSAANTSSGIKLTWNKVDNADGYYLYRKNSKGWAGIKKITSGDTESYIDPVSEGAYYTYTIRAYCKTSVSCYDKSGITRYRLTTPSINSGNRKTKNRISISWERNGNADGYQLAYYVNSTKKIITIKSNRTISCVISLPDTSNSCNVCIRTYKKDLSNVIHYSQWSGKYTISLQTVRKTLIIGDSRAYHMSIFGGSNVSRFYWLAEGDVKTSFVNASMENGHYKFNVTIGLAMPDALINTLTGINTAGYTIELASEIKEKGITTIVYALGTNSLRADSELNPAVRAAVTTMKRLKQETGCEVFFMATLPCNETLSWSNGYTNTNARILSYNEKVKLQCASWGLGYIDAYSLVNPADSTDGIHYGAVVCTKVVDFLTSTLY